MPATRFLRMLLASAALATLVLAAPVVSPAPVAGVGPLPACRLDDILTEPRGYDDWAITEVDWLLSVGPDYKPPDLVDVSKAGIAGGGLVRKVAINDLRALADAAREHGTPIAVFSPYRGYKQQVKLFDIYNRAYDNAVDFSQRPGHSEHQLGLAIDFITRGAKGMSSSWEQQPTGKWMAAHAWEYGWVMSYPKDKFDVVCFNYEPWHYRYLGRELAKKVHDSGLTIREYLWAHTTQVDPDCVALPAPSLGSPLRSCALATPTPAATAIPSTPPATSLASALASAAAVASPASTGPPTSLTGGGVALDPGIVVLGVVVLIVGGLLYAARRARRSP